MDASAARRYWWTFAQSFGGWCFGSQKLFASLYEQEFVYIVYTCTKWMVAFLFYPTMGIHHQITIVDGIFCLVRFLLNHQRFAKSKTMDFLFRHVLAKLNNYGCSKINGFCQQGFVELLVTNYLVTFVS